MGGQCPGAPKLKRPRQTERKGEKEDKEKGGAGQGRAGPRRVRCPWAPESPLSMGPEHPRYATV